MQVRAARESRDQFPGANGGRSRDLHIAVEVSAGVRDQGVVGKRGALVGEGHHTTRDRLTGNRLDAAHHPDGVSRGRAGGFDIQGHRGCSLRRELDPRGLRRRGVLRVPGVGDHEVLGTGELVRGDVELHGEGAVASAGDGLQRLSRDRRGQLSASQPATGTVTEDSRHLDVSRGVRRYAGLNLRWGRVRPGLEARDEQGQQSRQQQAQGRSSRPQDR